MKARCVLEASAFTWAAVAKVATAAVDVLLEDRELCDLDRCVCIVEKEKKRSGGCLTR